MSFTLHGTQSSYNISSTNGDARQRQEHMMTETQSVEALAQAVAREIEVSQTSSAIPLGPGGDGLERDDISDTINQVFALFRVNYANQYFSEAKRGRGELGAVVARRAQQLPVANYPPGRPSRYRNQRIPPQSLQNAGERLPAPAI